MSGLCNNVNLNLENDRKRTVKRVPSMKRHPSPNETPSPSPSPTTSVFTINQDAPNPTPTNDNLIDTDPSLYDHELHPDCPDTLACLPDTEGRPQHTLPVILRCAILGSPRKRLTIREIYAAMEAKYPYYKSAGPTWKQSVRHHLSLNRLFERQPRPVTDPGFGSYWTVNLSAPPGTKRPRKRGRANKDVVPGALPPIKKRGRPRKASLTAPRGLTPSMSSHDEDDEDDKLSLVGDDAANGSEDDYESEEDMVQPHDRRNSLVGLSAFPPTRPSLAFTLPPFSSLDQGSDSLVDRLQLEIGSLRRQSAEAVSVSLRLSEQVAQAQADSARLREALRDVEDMLEHETRKRREAERIADEEAKRRRSAEEALRGMVSASSRSRPS